MYDKAVVFRELEKQRKLTGLKLEYSAPEEIQRWREILTVFEEKPEQLPREAQAFIKTQYILCRSDARYWLENYYTIRDNDLHEVLCRFKPSQEVYFAKLAEAERERHAILEETGIQDGVFLATVKARKVGASTMFTGEVTRRALFFKNGRAMIGSATQQKSVDLWAMMELAYERSPWWLRPALHRQEKARHYYFKETNTWIELIHGKMEEPPGEGQTPNWGILSELPMWDFPEEIDSGLLPAVPRKLSSLFILESTGKQKHGWWHQFTDRALSGQGRFKFAFVGWYMEPSYISPVPFGWSPSPRTAAHADKVARTSPLYCNGKSIKLTLEQMYFWERTREEFASRKPSELALFYAAYCADHIEAFQVGNASMYDAEQIAWMLDTRSSCLMVPVEIDTRSTLDFEQ